MCMYIIVYTHIMYSAYVCVSKPPGYNSLSSEICLFVVLRRAAFRAKPPFWRMRRIPRSGMISSSKIWTWPYFKTWNTWTMSTRALQGHLVSFLRASRPRRAFFKWQNPCWVVSGNEMEIIRTCFTGDYKMSRRTIYSPTSIIGWDKRW